MISGIYFFKYLVVSVFFFFLQVLQIIINLIIYEPYESEKKNFIHINENIKNVFYFFV